MERELPSLSATISLQEGELCRLHLSRGEQVGASGAFVMAKRNAELNEHGRLPISQTLRISVCKECGEELDQNPQLALQLLVQINRPTPLSWVKKERKPHVPQPAHPADDVLAGIDALLEEAG